MQHMKPSTCKQRGSYKIYNAINKYGKENFYYEILEQNIDEDLIKYKHLSKKEIAKILGISYSYTCKLFKKYKIK